MRLCASTLQGGQALTPNDSLHGYGPVRYSEAQDGGEAAWPDAVRYQVCRIEDTNGKLLSSILG